jgi:hypothetical protein
VVGLRVGIDGEDLLVVFETADDIPLEPVDGTMISFSVGIDRDGDRQEDTFAITTNAGWQTIVFGPASPLPLTLAPATVDGRSVSLRLPLRWLGPEPDVRISGTASTVGGYPEWAMGMDMFTFADEMLARGEEELPLESWLDQVPGGKKRRVAHQEAELLRAAIAALPPEPEPPTVTPLRDVGTMLETVQPGGDLAEVASQVRASVAGDPEVRAALEEVAIRDLGALAAMDLEPLLASCDAGKTGSSHPHAWPCSCPCCGSTP